VSLSSGLPASCKVLRHQQWLKGKWLQAQGRPEHSDHLQSKTSPTKGWQGSISTQLSTG
jgi:hypothetical protein